MAAFRVLTIDGGGVRGLIPAIWLAHLETLTGKKTFELFDLIVGTSGGSIVGAAAALGNDVALSTRLYDEYGQDIFPDAKTTYGPLGIWGPLLKTWGGLVGPAYEEAELGSALQKVFGTGTLMSQCKVRFVAPAYDTASRAVQLLKSFEGAYADSPIWEVCKASSSAPTYFPAHEMPCDGLVRPLIDGGVFANNPSMLGVGEALSLSHADGSKVQVEDLRVVSLGAGNMKRPITRDDAKTWGSASWIRPLLDVIFDGTSEMSHLTAKALLGQEQYVRLQVQLVNVRDDLDDASRENLDRLRVIAVDFTQSDAGKFQFEQALRLLDIEM